MIMVLSCFDFLVVITSHPLVIIRIIFRLNEKHDLLAGTEIYQQHARMFIGFSIIALLVLSIERYLGVSSNIGNQTQTTNAPRSIIHSTSYLNDNFCE